jgi:hypothetical protein
VDDLVAEDVDDEIADAKLVLLLTIALEAEMTIEASVLVDEVVEMMDWVVLVFREGGGMALELSPGRG